IKDWTLENFIQVATDINFLKYSNTNAKNIQELRNLIHPYKESFEKSGNDGATKPMTSPSISLGGFNNIYHSKLQSNLT
ncbi:MAG: hypothetical protein ACPG7F_16665, partial [Aggregatilineales bacterium]